MGLCSVHLHSALCIYKIRFRFSELLLSIADLRESYDVQKNPRTQLLESVSGQNSIGILI